jgi:hypothetical protein
VPSASPWLAVDPVSDRLRHARALRRVHEAFHSGLEIGTSLRAVVAQSWVRTRDAGLDPIGHRAPIVLEEEAVSARWSEHPLFPVLPVLRELLSDATTQAGHMLVISDAAGILLWLEGHRQVMSATEDMHFVLGADWSEEGAGTNALGTAIAVDHPVQIFSAEHYSRLVHPWQCSGAPIHDPATGKTIGVVDLTGHLKTAHPHTLALVSAAAGMAEAYLRQDLLQRRAHLRERYRERSGRHAQRSALVDPHGEVLDAHPPGWLRGEVEPPAAGGEVVLPDGSRAVAEPLDDTGSFVLWRQCPGRVDHRIPPRLRLELLRSHPRALVDGRSVPLGTRHAEILALLALSPRGMDAEQLALELYGERGRPVTVRAELTRLRRLLGDVVLTRPYRLRAGVELDLEEIERLAAAGDLQQALARYDEPLLPRSEAQRVVEARNSLDAGLRERVLSRRDPSLIHRWCQTWSGRDDRPAASALVEALDPADGRRPEARARLGRLERGLEPQADEPTPW